MSITRPSRSGTGPPGTRELARLVLDRTIALGAVPAPPRHEQRRAQVVRDWWTADGLPAVSVHTIGERPAGQLDPDHPLATLAAHALREAGIPPRLTAASTDANAAYPRGIPALTLGITTGEGTHTEQEWIDADPVAAGLAALAATVARLDEQEW